MNQIKNNKLNICGVNANGLLNKIDSFDYWIKEREPTIFCIQETKVSKVGKIKSNQMIDYQMFELLRTVNPHLGGGLCIGVKNSLQAVQIREGDDVTEALTVEVEVGNQQMVVVNAYAPQLYDGPDKKGKFWSYLYREVEYADSEEKMLIIQMDANAWIGSQIIPNDPNHTNANGKLFIKFMETSHLTLVNSLPLCEGLITRQRKTLLLDEKSILDVFLVCKRTLPYLTSMKVDDAKKFPMTNYNTSSKNQNFTESDHNVLEISLDIQVPIIKPQRIEMYNFRDKRGQSFFHDITTNSNLKSCFETNKPFKIQAKQFERGLKRTFKSSFQIIRGKKRKRKEETEIESLFKERKKIRKEIVEKKSDENENWLKNIDQKIANLVQDKNWRKVWENFQEIASSETSVSTLGMWRKLKKTFPKVSAAVPTGVRDHKGRIITGTPAIKRIILRKFEQRMRRRPAIPAIKEIMQLKQQNARRIIKICRNVKTLPWTESEMKIVLKSLKNNKCRDPAGLINEIFKPGVIGLDLQHSLLSLFNKVKENMEIPDFMQCANIVQVYKNGGKDKLDVDSYRGLFIVSVFKSILQKLLLKDKISKIDSQMTDFQVGGRKGRNIRDHLFVVNGIIQDVLSSKTNRPIDILISDFKTCYDGLDLGLTCLDLPIRDDKLALLFDINRINRVAVKTALGMTHRVTMQELVMQGDCWGPIMASNSIDLFGKICLEKEENIYTYRNNIPIVPFTMCDDLLAISECGFKTNLMTSFINSQASFKFLQFGIKKCFKLHIGKERQKFKCCPIKLDCWKTEEVEDDNNEVKLKEVYLGTQTVKEVEEEKWLGNIISTDGKNEKDVRRKTNKGIGTINRIKLILENTPFGKYYFEVGKILIDSLLIGSILCNSEVAYNLIQSEIDVLEQCHERALRMLLECGQATPKIMLYYLTGSIPIRFQIQRRRLVYLQNILKQDKESQLFTFFAKQMETRKTKDWASTILKDLLKFEIKLTLDEIEKLTVVNWKQIVKEKTHKITLEYLNSQKGGKTEKFEFLEVSMIPYLLPNEDVSIQIAKFIVQIQCRIIREVKCNFRNDHKDNILCNACKISECTNSHLLSCQRLIGGNELLTYIPNYEDIFINNTKEQAYIASLMFENLRRKKAMESSE